MNNPNPLQPQGSLNQPAGGKSTVRIAVFTIVTVHAVFFAGLLMQGGCKRPPNDRDVSGVSSNELPRLDTNYFASLPDPVVTPEPSPTSASTPAPTSTSSYVPPVSTAPPVFNPPPAPLFSPAPLPATSDTPPANLLSSSPDSSQRYVVVKGDTLAKIAKAHHITVAELNRANPAVDPMRLKVKQVLQIPAPSPAPPASASSVRSAAEASAPSGNVHVVKAGDTLTRIARQHGTTVKALREANQLKTDRLAVKQRLTLPAASVAAEKTNATTPVKTP